MTKISAMDVLHDAGAVEQRCFSCGRNPIEGGGGGDILRGRIGVVFWPSFPPARSANRLGVIF